MPKNNGKLRRKARKEAARLRNNVSYHEKQGYSSDITRKVVENDLLLQEMGV